MKKITPILQRIKNLLHAKTDKEMAEKWGISYSTLDTWKNRDKIPEKRLLDFSLKYGVSFDWLLTGKGEPFPTSTNINIVEEQQDKENTTNSSHNTPPKLDKEFEVICEYLKDLDRSKRKKVLKYILELSDNGDE